MPNVKRLRKDNPYYLIPIMMGMAGVLFSRQIDDPLLRGTVVLLSVGVPLFVGGSLIARIRSVGLQRYLLIGGMIMLTIGAVVTVSGYSESLVERRMLSEEVAEFSRSLGMGSLLLGLLVVLYSMLRSEYLIDELGERFRHLAEHMSEGFVLIDAEGEIVLTNRSFTEMTGLSPEDLIGRNAIEMAIALDAESVAAHNATRSKGVASEYQIAWHRDGEEIQLWVSGTPLYDRRGRQIGTLATMRDITERHRLSKRLEEYTEGLQKLVEGQTQKLRESETRFRELLLHMNEGFLTIDAEYLIQFANDRVCELLKISAEDLLGREIFDFVDSPGRPRLRSVLEQAGAGEVVRGDNEYAFLRQNGAMVPVKVSIAPPRDDADERPEFSLVVTDVQELKDMHYQLELRASELEEVNRELRELDRAKDTFLSNVSHELRTPLSTLHGYIEMWEEGGLGKLQGPQSGALKVMARNAERLSMMINEMIEFSRMEIRGMRLHETLFDVKALIDECVSSAHPHLVGKDISASVYVPDAMPPIWADRDKLGQVVSILISNAIKFSHEQAMIQIRVSLEEGDDVAVDIIDTGIGIDPRNHQRIFRKFYQVDGTMTRHYQGTGIGLSIAKNIVDAHGGSVSLQSELKNGSTFTIRLPAAVFAGSARNSQGSALLDGAQVFVVNSVQEFRESICGVLDRCKCRVREFDNGYDCARSARQSRPDVIVLDEIIADMSETDAAAMLREDVDTAEVPIIAFRGGSEDESPHDAHLLDGVHILHKPFTVDALLRTLAYALGSSPEAGESQKKPEDKSTRAN